MSSSIDERECIMFKTLYGTSKATVISPQEAKRRLSSGEPVVLLDVRTPQEYEQIHIPNSISLPLDSLKQEVADRIPDKDAEIIVYCLSGARSSMACSQLISMGYTNVSNMGGIRSWRYETVHGRG